MAARTFVAPDGTSWQAWDVIPGQHANWPEQARRTLPAALGGGWLCFASATEKRRLYPIPAAWDAASDLQLWAHCLDASVVQRGRAARAEEESLASPA